MSSVIPRTTLSITSNNTSTTSTSAGGIVVPIGGNNIPELPPLDPKLITYSLFEQCERFRVSYPTMIKRFKRKKKLNSFGVIVGDGCQRLHRRYTDAQFAELLAASGRRAA